MKTNSPRKTVKMPPSYPEGLASRWFTPFLAYAYNIAHTKAKTMSDT